MNQKIRGRTRPKTNPAPLSIQAEIVEDYEDMPVEAVALAPEAAESVVVGPVTAEGVTVEPAEATSVAVSIAATAGGPPPCLKSPGSANSDEGFNVSAWQLKTYDLFNENVAAIFDFLSAFGQVTSLSDVIELNSRFASERYSTLLRQTNEIMELTDPVRLRAFPFVA
ncbi:hypothetical protein WOC76_20590 [Methylocystis sp. IM3]|jgi:hypothetical protein|uniref:hypothetical protein n=1 Tax=unclassified Methylocystis TaxID=2625913 RepID=UPI0030F635D2